MRGEPLFDSLKDSRIAIRTYVKRDGRIAICGEAVLVAISEIVAEL